MEEIQEFVIIILFSNVFDVKYHYQIYFSMS